MFSLLLFLWFAIGLTFAYIHIKGGDDFTLGDLVILLTGMIYGPLSIILMNPEIVLYKRKKKDVDKH